MTALVIDEVYSAKRVEYKAGHFYGNESDEVYSAKRVEYEAGHFYGNESDEVYSAKRVEYEAGHFYGNESDEVYSAKRVEYEAGHFYGNESDEVYSAKRVEYETGHFYGNESDEVTKTVLCIMIKSLAGKYNDMVTLHPIVSINSQKIKELFYKVLERVSEVGFYVCLALVDGHKTNMKFYRELGGGPIFLLHDSVHLFKNSYNNFVNKKQLYCPDLPYCHRMLPNVDQIVKLHRIELGKPDK